MLFEKLEWHSAHKFLHYFEIPIVAAGIILSSGHPSSLGAISLALPLKLHALWYSPMLPLIFFISAMTSGFAMAITVGLLGLRFFDDWHFKPGVFSGLGRLLLVFLSATLLLKIGDLAVAGELGLIFENSYQSKMFIIENLLGYVLPIIILLIPKYKNCRLWIFRAGILSVMGLVIHRINVSFVGLAGAEYYPTWQEVLSTAGLFSIGVILFWVVAKNIPLMEEEKE